MELLDINAQAAWHRTSRTAPFRDYLPDQWQSERRLLNQWGRWVLSNNHSSVQTFCGMSYYGTPRTIMDKIWECGAINQEEVTGYADSTVHVTNYLMHEIDRYMECLRRWMPWVYRALLARHLREFVGNPRQRRTEFQLATAIYGVTPKTSFSRFSHDCDMGYAMLQLRLMNYSLAIA